MGHAKICAPRKWIVVWLGTGTGPVSAPGDGTLLASCVSVRSCNTCEPISNIREHSEKVPNTIKAIPVSGEQLRGPLI